MRVEEYWAIFFYEEYEEYKHILFFKFMGIKLLYKQYMIAKKTLATTGSEYILYSDNEHLRTRKCTWWAFSREIPKSQHYVRKNSPYSGTYNPFSLEGYATRVFHSPFDRKTTVITRVDWTFLRRDISSDQTLALRAWGKGVLLKFLNDKSSK